MSVWKTIFATGKPIIGMVHVQALPGTPKSTHRQEEITEIAVREAMLFEQSGLEAILLENMHDVPYLNRGAGPEIIAAMTAVCVAVRKAVRLPIGIQILAGANREALAVALAAGLQFIRAEGYVYGHIADEGYMDSCAGELLRYRKSIGAEHIAVLTDIKKKHSAHNITGDVALGETASAAEFFLSDGLIITGSATGKEVRLDDLIEAKQHTALPVLLGSGVTADNIEKYWSLADGFIIGSHFKKDGNWEAGLSEERIRGFLSTVKQLSQ
jgi:uncharacterized protein